MRLLPAATAMVVPLLLVAGAAPAAADVDYRRYNLLHTGFTDKEVAPGIWHVSGSAHEVGGGVAVALYRAAELATAAHADELRITSQKVKALTMTRRFGGEIVGFTETARITVRFIRGDADRTACDEKDPRQCLTLPVAGVLARFGARLGQPVARAGEAAAPPVALVTFDKRQGGPLPWQIEAARRWPEPVGIPVRVTPDLALLLGRLASSTREPASAVPMPAATTPTAGTPGTPARPVPVALQVRSSAAPQRSAAEIERARLLAAAAGDGDPRGGVTVR